MWFRVLFLLTLCMLGTSLSQAEVQSGFLGTEYATYANGSEKHSYVLWLKNGSRLHVAPVNHLSKRFSQFRGQAVRLVLASHKARKSRVALAVSPITNLKGIKTARSEIHKVVFVLVNIDNIPAAISVNNLLQVIKNGESPGAGSLLDIIRGSTRGLLKLSYSTNEKNRTIFGPISIRSKANETCENAYRIWGTGLEKKLGSLG